jgi:hypothetical protein
MKHAVRVMVLGAILSGSVNAVAQNTAGQPALSKDLTEKATSHVVKKNKQLSGKKMKSADKHVGKSADPKAKNKQDNMTENPPESNDPVKIRGVRG